jgi:glycosyltransferase involved in cell wall biosynthesis
MLHLTNDDPRVCIVGRCNFNTGIGAITYGLAEVLSRSFATCILPTEPALQQEEAVVLPNGRRIPVCKDPGSIAVSFFCDVLWNGVHDFNYALMPPDSLKFAYLVYDSDELPPRWAQLLNTHFDLIIASSPEMIPVARASQVETPIATLPIPLDLDGMLAEGLGPRERKVRFGSVAAFHPRKGVQTLLEAFLRLYGDRPEEAELVLHSNLAFGEAFRDVQRLIDSSGASNVTVSHGSLDVQQKNALIKSFDVFANCSRGEGYSIGAREALAYGKSLVLSDVGGHRDLLDHPGVFAIEADVSLPARYPEIDNGVFGRQRAVRVQPTMAALEQAFAFARSPAYEKTLHIRRGAAQAFTFSRLTAAFATLIDPGTGQFRQLRQDGRLLDIPAEVRSVVESRLGRHASIIPHARRRVVAAHDGGFFSIFNAFMNHLAWDIREDRCHSTLPDWDVDRLIDRQGDTRVMSFCYGQPGDGNLWTRLFQPLHGFTAEEMNDETALYAHTDGVSIGGDYAREPLMTYVHAYKLYHSRGFEGWRRQYHKVFQEHVSLRPELQAEVDGFVARHLGRRFLVAAHVRHPSHTVEQPNAEIAHTDSYIRRIYTVLEERGIPRESEDWGVFLATDQERVVAMFRAEFGDRVAYFDDVRRTRAAEDAAFEALSAEEKNQEGHQLQHLVAASRDQWSLAMAWEVVRDAYCMARCNVLLHVVSNVSTAVAYMNPDMEMIFCSAA